MLQLLSFVDNKVQNWFQRQSSWQMNKEYDTEFAIGVAAAAYVIDNEAQQRIKTERSRQDTTTRLRNSDRVTRRYSSMEVKTAGNNHSTRHCLVIVFARSLLKLMQHSCHCILNPHIGELILVSKPPLN